MGTQDEDKTTTQTKKVRKHGTDQTLGWIQVLSKGTQFLLLIIHPSCYSYSQVRKKYFISAKLQANYVIYTSTGG